MSRILCALFLLFFITINQVRIIKKRKKLNLNDTSELSLIKKNNAIDIFYAESKCE